MGSPLSFRPADTDIAIVGMACRLPGARTVEEFWQNLRGGVDAVTWLTDDELRASGVPQADLEDPDYVRAAYLMPDMDRFDGSFFGFSPREAAIMDPQQRHFIECCWEALERAGHTPEHFEGSVGVFGGCGTNTHMMFNLLTNPELVRSVGYFLLKHTGNDKDFLTTRVSYLLDLTGPSVNVQTACSTSLVAIHMAAQSLINGECDLALAGGSTVRQPHKVGYLYREGEILSPDGRCRPFDAEAAGTVFGSGAGVVVLRRLADALADGDHVHAVIKGSAINNDGAMKVGYLAPSVEGQARVIAEALAIAAVSPEEVGYVETHGTGTPVGDPIEVTALTQAFGSESERSGFCAIGSLKSNVGHLDTAAGVASLIKTVLALEHGELPPSLHYQAPNPEIDFERSPFHVNARLTPWRADGAPRRAGVSALGVGGTNAHVILEEAPPLPASGTSRKSQLFVVSAKTADALAQAEVRLAEGLRSEEHPLADVAHTLRLGRWALPERRAVVASSAEEAAALLHSEPPERRIRGRAGEAERPVAFLFAGGGAQYPNMGLGLYQSEAVYREAADECLQRLEGRLDTDLRRLLFPPPGGEEAAASELQRPSRALPALFLTQYAQARLWTSWGVAPSAMIGHSMGEYTAACLASVMSLEDALAIVTRRGELFERLPEGGMLSVPLPEDELRPYLGDALSIAAVNAPELCVASGPVEAIDTLARRLAAEEIDTQRIHISVAAHSAMLEPILADFGSAVRGIDLQPPRIPFVSNLTGDWARAEDVTDPQYWVRHLRQTVRYADGLTRLLEDSARILLEVGPGRTLSTLARLHRARTKGHVILHSLRHPGEEEGEDLPFMLSALGRLWSAGARPDWKAFAAGESRRRVLLPTYPWEHQRHWIEPPKGSASATASGASADPAAPLARQSDRADWFWQAAWRRAAAPPAPASEPGRVLVLGAERGPGAALARTLAEAGWEVVPVGSGAAFAAENGAFTVRLDAPEDWETLVGTLAAGDGVPAKVLHLWNLGDPEPAGTTRLAIDQAFTSLFLFARALGNEAVDAEIDLVIASTGAQRVRGSAVPHPLRALSLGPCRVIPKELPNVRCRSVDLDAGGHASEWAGALLGELSAPADEQVVAHRAGERFVQGFAPLRLEEPTDPLRRLREGGVYVITGGLGGIGLTVGAHLARAVRARLVLVSRRGLPSRDQWGGLLANGDASVAAQVRAVREIEALGGEVLVVAGDVTDAAAMSRVRAAALERFGTVHGVIHAAGVLDDGLIQLKEPAAAAAVLAPKVAGTLALEQAFGDDALDLFVMFSSRSAVSGIPGQIDYTAANAFLDAWAQHRDGVGGRLTLALAWGAWREVGMAAALSGGLAAGAAAFATMGDSVEVSHPILARRMSAGGDDVFEGTLSTSEHWLVDEHRVRGGSAVVPGTGYLELLAAAARERDGRPAELRDVLFLLPFAVRDGDPQQIRVRVTGNGADGAELAIESPAGGGWREHARASVTWDPGPRPPVKLEAVAAACRAGDMEVKVAERRAHLELGPRWNSLRHVRFGEGEVFLSLELPEEFSGDLEQFRLHPALMDVAVAWGQRIIPGFDDERDFYVPASYGSVRVYAPLPRRVFSHIRYRSQESVPGEMVSFDVTVFDERGAVLVDVEEFTMVRLAQGVTLDGAAAGPTAGAASDHPRGGPAGLDLEEAIDPREGADCFARVIAGPVPPHVIVSPHDLPGWLHRVAHPPEPPPAQSAAAGGPGIDVGPVEEALSAHEAVAEVAVTASGSRAAPRIVAHVVFDPDGHATVSELRRFLRERLPEELVPQHFIDLDALPRSADGRLDRSALDDPFAGADEFVGPRTETEGVVAAIWSELLGTEGVSVHDNFLDIGGHSLLVIRALSRIQKKTGVRLTPSALNLHTLEQIAAECDQKREPVGAR